ncbi:YDG domain-containing protein [Soonwooa sp.]|uniref:YDG domain-containing protein n=1 Tax=Soonwooa sp. TaxID=1938592 RepID=UPI0035B4C441
MKKSLFSFTKYVFALVFLLLSQWNWGQIAAWTGPWVGTAASPLQATTKNTNINVANVSRSGLNAVASTARHNSSNWHQADRFLVVQLTTNSGYTMNLQGATITGTFGASGTGPSGFVLYSSIDNYTSSLGNPDGTITLPNTAAYNNLTSITFRIKSTNTPSNTGGTGGFSAFTINGSTVLANIAPTASNVSITGTTTVGANLTGSYTYADAENDPQGTSTYKWYTATDNTGAGATAISGAAANNYTLTSAELGKYIRFGVVPVATTGTTTGTEAFSSWVGPVTTTSPYFTTTGTVSSMSTVYGTASTPQSFTFTGSNLTGTNVTVSAPAGFEIAMSSGGTYSSSLTYAISGGSASGTVYVRLAATTAVGTYAGNVSLTAGTTNTTVAIPNSTVTPRALTVAGLSASNKVYDGTTATSLSGTATLNGVVTGDTVNILGTAIGTFADKNVGTGKTINISGLSLSGAQASNYTLTQPTTSANITAKEVTISGAVAGDKTYDGNNTAVITGTLSGVISPDNVTLNGTGTFASVNAATGIGVSSTSTISGTDAGNYTLTQPIGLTANITKVSLTATADNKTKQVNTANPALTITYTGFVNGETSTTATGFIAPSISTTAVTNSPVGTYPITLSGGSASNYNITLVNGTLSVVLENNTVGDYRTNPSFTGSAIYFNSTTASNGVYPWQRWDGSQWTDVTNSSSAPQSLTTKPENIYCNYSSVNAAGGGTYNNIIVQGGYFYSGNTSTGITIGAGKSLDIKGGYVLIDGRLVFSANSKLAVRENAEFMLGMISSNFILPTTVSFEIEDNGYVYINQYLAQIWNGTENFAGNSVVGIYGWNRSNRLFTSESDITSNATTGAKFGYLDIDIADGVLSGDWTYVFPADTFVLTAHDFNVTSADASNNISLNYGDMTIGGDFIINGTSTTKYIQATAQAADKTLTVNGSIIKNGVIEFILLASGNNVTTNVKGNITVNDGVFNINQNTSGTSISTINLEGDLKVSTTGKISASAKTNNSINFKGTGNGLTEATTQTIDIANQSTSPYVVYNVNSGAYVKLINQNLSLGTNSAFNVLSGGTLDFGLAADGTTALNIGRVSSQTGQSFISKAGSLLKITSPLGINKGGDYTGNVQVGSTTTTLESTSSRFFDGGATYHYIGKENQKSGDGLPDGLTKKLIVDLQTTDVLNENLEFRADGIIKFNSEGTLEIRKGKVIDEPGKGFRNNVVENEDGESDNQKGNILMTGGRYVVSGSGTKPSLSGSYTLSDGTIQFAGIAATKIRTSSSPVKQYYNVDVSGTNVEAGGKNLIVNQVTKVTGTGKLTIREADDDENPYVLTAKKGIQVDGTATALFENNAQLMQDVDAANSGNVTMERKTKMKKMDYIYWGTPVQGDATSGQILLNTTNPDLETSSGGFSPGTPNKRIYRYNEPNDYFVATTDAYFIPGKGYAIRGKHGNGDTKTADTFSFTGTPNNGDAITVSVQRSPNNAYNHGYNLIGNPYPSGLNFDEFATDNIASIKGTAWFWSNLEDNLYQSGSTNSTHNNYAVLTLAGGSPPTTGAGGLAEYTPTENIKVGQGFIVQVRDELASTSLETRTLVFKNDMRTTGAGVFFNNPKKLSPIKNRYWLRFVSPDNVVNTILLAHLTNATDGYDQDYDAELFTVGDDSFYSLLGTKKLQIQAKGEFVQDAKIDIATKQNQDGNYTIQLEQPEGVFANGQAVYLHDKLNGTYTNLLEQSYTFAATKGTDEFRFEIVYKDGVVLGVGNASKSDFIVYRNGSDFVVKSSKILGKVEVYDTAGRLVFAQTTSNNILKLDTSRLPEGVFIIKAENSGDIKTKKILK